MNTIKLLTVLVLFFIGIFTQQGIAQSTLLFEETSEAIQSGVIVDLGEMTMMDIEGKVILSPPSIGAVEMTQTTPSNGSTYYMSANGSDSTGDGSHNNEWATFAYAFTQMNGGDTLIVKDGTYYNNVIVDPPSGTINNFTTIKAENIGSVTIDDTHSSTAGYPGSVLEINTSYIKIDGIKFQNGGENIGELGSSANRVYIKNSAFINADVGSTYAVVFRNNANNSLVEDTWFAGGGRYLIADSRGRYNIYRRCVGRWDYSKGNQPIGGFMNYHEQAVGNGTTATYQNSIVIDFNDPIGHNTWLTGGFADKYGHNITRMGNIAMNILSSSQTGQNATGGKIGQRMRAFFDEPSDQDGRAGVNTYENNVVINSYKGLGQIRRGTTNINKMTFINSMQNAIDLAKGSPGISLVNGLFLNNGAGSTTSNISYSYSHFQGETQRGTNSTDDDCGLLYPLRIENTSSCYGSGENGENRGATILNKIGVDGTFYGDSGWNVTTSESLWPFPNEDFIKRDFSDVPTTPSGAIPVVSNSTRGFAASGTGLYGGPITLTSYIWEYLGNVCPSDICSYGSTFLIFADGFE